MRSKPENDWLPWLVDFAETDPATADPALFTRFWQLALDPRAMAIGGLRLQPYMDDRTGAAVTRFWRTERRRLHRDVRALLTMHTAPVEASAPELEPPPVTIGAIKLHVFTGWNGDPRAGADPVRRLYATGPRRTLLLFGLATALREDSQQRKPRLRRCANADCQGLAGRRFFLSAGKRTHCTTACSDRACSRRYYAAWLKRQAEEERQRRADAQRATRQTRRSR